MRLTFELVDLVKQIALPDVSGLHTIGRRFEQNENADEEETLPLSWDIHFVLPLDLS